MSTSAQERVSIDDAYDALHIDYGVRTSDGQVHQVTEWLNGIVLTDTHVVYPRNVQSGSVAAMVATAIEYAD